MHGSLKTLLETRSILKVGVNIAGDVSRLESDFAINVPRDSILDCATYAVSLKKLVTRVSLALLTENLLAKLLEKNEIRTSEWSVNRLSVRQVNYAALDALASIDCYIHLEQNKDPIFSDYATSSLLPGCRVTVYNVESGTAIATGTIEKIALNSPFLKGSFSDTVSAGRFSLCDVSVIVPAALIPLPLHPPRLGKMNPQSLPIRPSLVDFLLLSNKRLLVKCSSVRPCSIPLGLLLLHLQKLKFLLPIPRKHHLVLMLT
jgi:hypothetical protein